MTALVTGGQRGIGLGIAKALAGSGHTLVLASSSAPDSPEVERALQMLGPSARYFRHDLKNVHEAAKLVAAVEDAVGPLSTLVANAGVPAKVRGDMLEIAADAFDHVLGVNLRGTFFLAQAVARRMAARSSGIYRSLIFITSVSAQIASVERAEYCISKAGAAMTAKLFAVRLAPLGIGVFELRPGVVETAMTAGVKDMYTRRISEGLVPAGRWGQPDDVGSAVVPLAEGDMAFATGATVPVDGGLSIHRL